jgi:hypothetical protein
LRGADARGKLFGVQEPLIEREEVVGLEFHKRVMENAERTRRLAEKAQAKLDALRAQE